MKRHVERRKTVFGSVEDGSGGCVESAEDAGCDGLRGVLEVDRGGDRVVFRFERLGLEQPAHCGLKYYKYKRGKTTTDHVTALAR